MYVVTFVKVSVETIDVTWVAGHVAVHMCVPQGVRLNLDDCATKTYLTSTSIRAPEIIIKVLISDPASLKEAIWSEAATIATNIHFKVFNAPDNWETKAFKQAAFVTEQDRLTDRATFMQNQMIQPNGDLPRWTIGRYSSFQ